MKWLTKQLALDLLAITIDGLNKAFNRIEQTPDPVHGDWPPTGNTYNMGGYGPTEREQEVEKPAAEPAPAQVEKKLTLEDVRKVLLEVRKDPNHGKPALKKILNAVGAPKLTAVPEDKYTEVLELAKKEMAA